MALFRIKPDTINQAIGQLPALVFPELHMAFARLRAILIKKVQFNKRSCSSYNNDFYQPLLYLIEIMSSHKRSTASHRSHSIIYSLCPITAGYKPPFFYTNQIGPTMIAGTIYPTAPLWLDGLLKMFFFLQWSHSFRGLRAKSINDLSGHLSYLILILFTWYSILSNVVSVVLENSTMSIASGLYINSQMSVTIIYCYQKTTFSIIFSTRYIRVSLATLRTCVYRYFCVIFLFYLCFGDSFRLPNI